MTVIETGGKAPRATYREGRGCVGGENYAALLLELGCSLQGRALVMVLDGYHDRESYL